MHGDGEAQSSFQIHAMAPNVSDFGDAHMESIRTESIREIAGL